MQSPNTPSPLAPAGLPPQLPAVSLPVTLVADVQDALLMAMTDLKRLEGLLDHATGNLLERFSTANHALAHLAGEVDQQHVHAAPADLDADGEGSVGVERHRHRRLADLLAPVFSRHAPTP